MRERTFPQLAWGGGTRAIARLDGKRTLRLQPVLPRPTGFINQHPNKGHKKKTPGSAWLFGQHGRARLLPTRADRTSIVDQALSIHRQGRIAADR